MKLRKNIFKFVIPAAILCCLLVAGSLFASGSAAPKTEDKLNLIVTVPSESVEANGTFEVAVKITNESVASFKLAGLQVELAYDEAAVTPADNAVTMLLDTDESTAVANAADGMVKFVCVKNEFTDDEGYAVLNDLFKVTFKANAAIKNPAALFSADDITYLMGDTTALEIANTDKLYAADKEALAKAILNSDLKLVVGENVGTVVVAPSTSDKAMTKATLEAAVNGAVVTAESGIIGTGAKIEVGGDAADIVVMGDVDGDGVVTVFDAMIIIKANSETAEDGDKFDGKELNEFAADNDGNGSADKSDASSWLDFILGK